MSAVSRPSSKADTVDGGPYVAVEATRPTTTYPTRNPATTATKSVVGVTTIPRRRIHSSIERPPSWATNAAGRAELVVQVVLLPSTLIDVVLHQRLFQREPRLRLRMGYDLVVVLVLPDPRLGLLDLGEFTKG
jgi:hypothetical protein